MMAQSSSPSEAITSDKRLSVACRAAETVFSPRPLIESATVRRLPGGIRRTAKPFRTNPSTSCEVAGRDSPRNSATAESDVPGSRLTNANARNCGTERSDPRCRRIWARINCMTVGTVSRISAAQPLEEPAELVRCCNCFILQLYRALGLKVNRAESAIRAYRHARTQPCPKSPRDDSNQVLLGTWVQRYSLRKITPASRASALRVMLLEAALPYLKCKLPASNARRCKSEPQSAG